MPYSPSQYNRTKYCGNKSSLGRRSTLAPHHFELGTSASQPINFCHNTSILEKPLRPQIGICQYNGPNIVNYTMEQFRKYHYAWAEYEHPTNEGILDTTYPHCKTLKPTWISHWIIGCRTVWNQQIKYHPHWFFHHHEDWHVPWSMPYVAHPRLCITHHDPTLALFSTSVSGPQTHIHHWFWRLT